ncbi:MAG: hypothetical protein ABEJ70_06475 [Halobacteriaceae archaeon]
MDRDTGRWVAGGAAGAIATVAVAWGLAVSVDLAGTLGVVVGAYVWVAVGYPAATRLHFRTLAGPDRWLAGVALLVVAAALAAVSRAPLPWPVSAVLFVDVLLTSVVLVSLGALVGVRGGLSRA